MRIRTVSMALMALLLSGCALWGPYDPVSADLAGPDGDLDPATIDIGTTDTIND